jgi:glycerophosphoryl diester phosphodiesterase
VQAIKVGAKYLEIDIQFSADGVPMIHHDGNLKRMTQVDGIIHQWNFKDLMNLKVDERSRFGDQYNETLTPLNALNDILLEHSGVYVFVEIKKDNLEFFSRRFILERIIDALALVMKQCILISFDEKIVNLAHSHFGTRVGLILNNWSQYQYIKENNINPEFLFCDVKKMCAIHNYFCDDWKWVMYEVASFDTAKRLFDRGISMVETFEIENMLQHSKSICDV